MSHTVVLSRLGRTIYLACCLAAAATGWARADDKAPSPAADAPSEPLVEEADPNDPKVLLQFKFKPGQVVRYEVATEMKMSTFFSDATEVARNKATTRRNYKVTKVTPQGEGTLELSIDWVHMLAEFDTGDSKTTPIEFKSDDPTRQPKQFQQILEMVGRPTARIKIDRSGRPLHVEPLNGQRPKTPDAAVKGSSLPVNPLKTALEDASPENYLVPLPEKEVSPGNTWKERFDVVVRDEANFPKKIVMQRTYKFTELKDGQATIEYRTGILTPVEDPSIEAQLIQRETSGKIVFDVEKGMIVSREARIEKTVVNPFGEKSSMQASSRYHERLLPDDATANRESGAVSTSSKQ